MRLFSKLFSRDAAELLEYSVLEHQIIGRRASPGTNLNFTVKNVLEVKKTMAVSDWVKLSNITRSPGFGYQAFRALMQRNGGLPDIHKLITALEQNNSMNPILKSEFMTAFDVHRNSCTKEDIKYVTGAIDEVLSKFPVLTKELGNSLLRGLSLLPVWNEKAELILSKMGDTADYSTDGVLALVAFTHGKYDEGFVYLKKAMSAGIPLHPIVYHRLLQGHETYPKENIPFRLLTFLEDHYHMISLSVAQELARILDKSESWVSRFVHLNHSGKCGICKKQLQKLPLSAEEHMLLLQEIEKRFDLNCSFTTYQREEVAAFKMFLKENPPYTIVIDGCNLFYLNDMYRWKRVCNMLEKQGHKILLLCKEHLRRERVFRDIFKRHLFYYVKNSTMDDTFIIYSAVSSGRDTAVLTNDYFGTYFSNITGSARVLFRRWQLSNQIVSGQNELVFPKYSPVCQKSEDGKTIHVPLVPDKSYKVYAPSGWLCLHKVSKEEKQNASRLWPQKQFQLQDKFVGDSFKMHATHIKEDLRKRKPRVNSKYVTEFQ